jgi:hypothetical protein
MALPRYEGIDAVSGLAFQMQSVINSIVIYQEVIPPDIWDYIQELLLTILDLQYQLTLQNAIKLMGYINNIPNTADMMVYMNPLTLYTP